MTWNELATTPEIVLVLLVGMFGLLTAITTFLWKISKAILPVLHTWRVDLVKHKEHCEGEFKLVGNRLDDHNNRIEHIEVQIKDKYDAQG